MKQLTYDLIKSFNPCYDPIKYIPENWVGTSLDILELKDVPAKDKLWVVLRKNCLSDRVLRLFAVGCAERALSKIKNPDPRSIEACRIARAYALGEVLLDELKRARDDAYAATDADATATAATADAAAAAAYADAAAATAATATAYADAAAATAATADAATDADATATAATADADAATAYADAAAAYAAAAAAYAAAATAYAADAADAAAYADEQSIQVIQLIAIIKENKELN